MTMRSLLLGSLALLSFCNGALGVPVPPEFVTPQQRLFFYAGENDPAGIRQALADGASVDSSSEIWTGKDVTALYFAALLNNLEAVKCLLEEGASIDQNTRNTPLNPAASHGYTDVLKLLYEAAQDLPQDRRRLYARMALREAAYGGHFEAFRYLIEAGANREGNLIGRDSDADILRGVILTDNLEMLRFLIEELDVDPSIRGDFATPAYLAAEHGRPEILGYLLQHGADPGAFYDGLMPLSIAARNGHVECVEILLDAGAKAVSERGQRAANQADLGGQAATLEVFRQRGYESNLWEVWQEKYRKPPKRYESISEVGNQLTASLLTGNWPDPVPGEIDQSIRLAIVADDASATLANFLTAELTGVNGVKLVERQELETVLAERKMAREGLVKGDNLGSLAELIHADALVIINRESAGKEELLRTRLIDARRGLLKDVRYAPAEAKAAPEFAERYAEFAGHSFARLNEAQSGLTPVALIDVRVDHLSPEAQHAARMTRSAFEHSLANRPELLLLDRQSLDLLLQENHLAGRLGLDGAQASAGLIDARIDWNASAGQIDRMVVRVERNGTEESFTPEVAGTPLPELVAKAAALVAGASENVDPEGANNSIQRDRDTLVAEANWLFQQKLYLDAFKSMRNALALGADRPEDWRLYGIIVRELIDRLFYQQATYDDATNRQMLELELEWIRANRKFLRAIKADPRLQLTGDLARDSGLGVDDFYRALNRFHPVVLQTRYHEEMSEIEKQYVAFVVIITPLW